MRDMGHGNILTHMVNEIWDIKGGDFNHDKPDVLLLNNIDGRGRNIQQDTRIS